MTLKIGPATSILGIQRKLAESTARVDKSLERLATGLRINRASDDAAGLQISENLRVEARIQSQAVRNINDGISLLSVADAAITELKNVQSRMLELAQGAANGTLSDAQRGAMDEEFRALSIEARRILDVTEFNGEPLFSTPKPDLALTQVTNTVGTGVNGFYSRGSDDGRYLTYFDETAHELVLFDAETQERTVIASIAAAANLGALDVSASGARVAFVSNLNLTGQNASLYQQAFIYDRESGELTQVTNHAGAQSGFHGLALSADGSTLAFASASNYVSGGTLADGVTYNGTADALYSYDIETGVFTTIVARSVLSFFAGVGLSADGSFASFASSSNILGTNPDQTIDIFAVNTSDPSSLRQITAVAVGFETPQTFVTRDGDVYLIAAENYGGLNPGGLQQLFGYSWADDQLRQITSNTLLNGAFLALSSDDSYLTYINTVDLVGENPNYRFQSYRFDLQSQTFEQTTNFTSNIAGAGGFVAGNGNRFFLYSSSDLTGENSDGSTELFSVTISGASRILDVEVGGGTTGGIEINIDAARQAALSIGGLTISSQVEARGAIQSLKRDMGNLELLSADIGSGINRLTLAAGNASLMSEELQAAASRIREVDVAEEAAELIKNSILQNAAAALLAQANQQPNLVLRLIDNSN